MKKGISNYLLKDFSHISIALKGFERQKWENRNSSPESITDFEEIGG